MEQSSAPDPLLNTPMKEFQRYHQASLDAYPEETLEEYLIRKGDFAFRDYLRAQQ